MPIRIPWDQYEVAILIDACIHYNAGEITKDTAVKEVSAKLRNRAVSNGLEIDEVFRNENGITMQFMLMNELLTEQKSGLRGASKLFVEMANIYKSDVDTYQKILKEAVSVESNKTIKEEFFAWLSGRVTGTQLSDSYLVCDEIDKFCTESNAFTTGMFGTRSINYINKLSRVLASDKNFRQEHKRGLSKVRGVLYYYVRFLQDVPNDKLSQYELIRYSITNELEDNEFDLETNNEDAGTEIENQYVQEDIDESRILQDIVHVENDDYYYKEILVECFENGFRINSSIDKARIRMYYKEKYGRDISLSDNEIMEELLKVGIVRDDRIYVNRKGEYTQLIDEIYTTVMRLFDNGISCVYEEAIYKKYSIELVEKAQLYDSEELGNLLLQMSKGKLKKSHSYLCLVSGQWNLEQDVLNVLKNSSVPMTYDDIQEVMWYAPIERIKFIMVNLKPVVYMESETYFYAPNLPVSSEELMHIKLIIQKFLENRTYVTDTELRAAVYGQYPSIEINTAGYTTYGLRNCLAYIFRDEFSFNGPIISEQGNEIGIAEVFAEYCKDREQVSTDELKELAVALGTNVICWDDVRNVTIRISDDMLIRDNLLEFDVEATDKVLDEYIKNEYVPLKKIGLFTHFPSISVPWNGYVLESYLYKYSKKFRLVHTSFSASGYFGAMVRTDSTLADYKSLITDALAHSDIWNDKQSALEFLVEKGYQQRRRYEGIEAVVKEAGLLREKIKEVKK